MILAIEDFDCILGTDVLTSYRATVDYYPKIVQFRSIEGDIWFFYGEVSRPLMPLVSASQTLEASGEDYLIYVIGTSIWSRAFEEIQVVFKYPDVFSDKIPEFPPVREVKFGIELVSGTTSISCEPYRLTPAEMRDFQQQLQDLLDKGYI
ncbi:uncharacterized protein [Henckelia pumila]|uniref:uncharacterized protein n=1 Tax=Henckelia pumila TaxID=405737 RepID=UPI003C6DF4E3